MHTKGPEAKAGGSSQNAGAARRRPDSRQQLKTRGCFAKARRRTLPQRVEDPTHNRAYRRHWRSASKTRLTTTRVAETLAASRRAELVQGELRACAAPRLEQDARDSDAAAVRGASARAPARSITKRTAERLLARAPTRTPSTRSARRTCAKAREVQATAVR